MAIRVKSPWGTHDFKVKTLEGATGGAGGSRLGFTCRKCDRQFSQTPLNRRTWAINEAGMALESAVTDRWLSEVCPRLPAVTDEDRKRLRSPARPPKALSQV